MNTSKFSTAKKAFKLFSHEGVDKAIVRANVVKFIAAMEYLGPKHLLATKIQRKN